MKIALDPSMLRRPILSEVARIAAETGDERYPPQPAGSPAAAAGG